MSGVFPDSGVPPQDANNSLPDPNTINCPAELWYSTSRCTPRFDPSAANAVTSEIINLVQCAGLPYDCSRLDNLCQAVTNLICDVITGCLPCTFPPSSQACRIEQLVLEVDAAGCQRIARYSAASSAIGFFGSNTVWPINSNIARPATPSNAATYYNVYELYTDVIAGTVNEAKLTDNLIAQGNVTVACDQSVEIRAFGTTVFDPTLAGTSAFVARIDGQFRHYGGLINRIGGWTSFDNSVDVSVLETLSAGSHNIKVYVLAFDPSKPAAQIGVGVNPQNISQSGFNISTAIV